MKQQTDLTAKDLSRLAIRSFRGLMNEHGRDNVTGGEWYVRLGQGTSGAPLLLLVIPVSIRNSRGEWTPDEWKVVVA